MMIYKKLNVGSKMEHKITRLFSIIFIFSFACFVNAQVYLADSCRVTFFSDGILEDIEAVSVMPEGSTYAAYNSTNGKFSFKIPIKSFHFENSLMQEHFNENYMESDKYPFALFKGTIENKDGSGMAKGEFTVHGVMKTRDIKGSIDKGEKGLTITSEFWVKTADHKIKIPKLLVKNLAEEIKVNVYCEFKE